MMTLASTDRATLILVGAVAIPYVALALGAILAAEVRQRAHAKAAAAKEETTAAAGKVDGDTVTYYCPECQRAVLATGHMAPAPLHAIQALCPAHQRHPAYVAESNQLHPTGQSAQNAQPLIRRIPVQFAEPARAAWETERRRAEEWEAQPAYRTSDGNCFGTFWAYVDPVDPIWN